MFQEFLTRKEDYLRALRGFLREIVRQVRNEFNFYVFVWSLMQRREESEFSSMEQQHKVCVCPCMYTCTCIYVHVHVHVYIIQF